MDILCILCVLAIYMAVLICIVLTIFTSVVLYEFFTSAYDVVSDWVQELKWEVSLRELAEADKDGRLMVPPEGESDG